MFINGVHVVALVLEEGICKFFFIIVRRSLSSSSYNDIMQNDMEDDACSTRRITKHKTKKQEISRK